MSIRVAPPIERLLGVVGLALAGYLAFFFKPSGVSLFGASSIETPSYAPVFAIAIALVSVWLVTARRVRS